MAKLILLTGRPGSGKTTIIRRVLSFISINAGGFFTQEIREKGKRTGFKIITLNNQEGILAHVKLEGKQRFGKYGLDLGVLNELGVGSIIRAMNSKELIVIDEIGPMEIRSVEFRNAVLAALESGIPIIGTIVKRSIPFKDYIKSNPIVQLIDVDQEMPEAIIYRIIRLLRQDDNYDLHIRKNFST